MREPETCTCNVARKRKKNAAPHLDLRHRHNQRTSAARAMHNTGNCTVTASHTACGKNETSEGKGWIEIGSRLWSRAIHSNKCAGTVASCAIMMRDALCGISTSF